MKEVKGISFPFRVGSRGGIAMSGRTAMGQMHIKERFMALLGIREGERVMRPTNGIEDLDIFFNDLNETTKNMAIFKIREAIEEWEPELEIHSIDIHEERLPEGIAHVIEISYTDNSGEYNNITLSV